MLVAMLVVVIDAKPLAGVDARDRPMKPMGPMKPMTRIVRVLAAAAVSTTVLGASAASADAAAITVTPDNGLADIGQTVSVSGSGYAPTNPVFIAECIPTFAACSATLNPGGTAPDGSGNFGPININVGRTFGSVDCAVAPGCILVANQPMGSNFANQPISFASGETLALTPASHDFGSTFVSGMSAPQTFTVTANGTGPVNISTTGISGDIDQFVRSNDTCGGILNATQSCTLDVTFAPIAAGPATAELRIESDAPGTPHIATLSGSGVAQPTTPVTQPPAATPTGERAAALKRCKNKRTKKARKQCRKRAKRLPV
jgi:hypothetical protein